MNKTISPMSILGIIIFVMYTIVDRFITPISDWVAIPLLVVGIVLTIVGIYQGVKNHKLQQ